MTGPSLQNRILTKQAGITVTDEELDFTLKEIKSRYNLDEKEMEKALEKQNMTEESFREQWSSSRKEMPAAGNFSPTNW